MPDVLAAAERIHGYVHKTPVMTSRLLNAATGKQIFLKCENLQRAGAFKARGAFNFVLQMTAEERARGVVAYSSGNHAQALALAANELGVKADIVMPDDAPKSKVAATRAYGAEIHFYDRMSGDRERMALDIAERTGATVVPPFDHERIVSGAGTASLELLTEVPDLDTIVTPLGGGGLLSGSILAVESVKRRVRVFGVEPQRANDWFQSVERGERVKIDPPDTIADGLRTLSPGKLAFQIVRSHGNPVLLVSEDEITRAMRFLMSRVKLVVEPSGSVGVAAAMNGRLPESARKVGIVLSGGNVDLFAGDAVV